MKKNTDIVAIGEKMKILRKASGKTQDQVAEVIDVHTPFYGRLERGEQDMRVSSLIKIAKALNVHPSVLLENINVVSASKD